MSPLFRKKPVVIRAEQVPLRGEMHIAEHGPVLGMFFEAKFGDFVIAEDHGYDIGTLEGTMHASPGDWIIRGVAGEFYPCKPDIFAATYEAISGVSGVVETGEDTP